MRHIDSPSGKLIAAMHHAALTALAQTPQGALRQADLMRQIEQRVPLDDWARTAYETTGHTRWRSIFAFASVALVKGGYVIKDKGVWTLTDEGRAVVSQPYDAQAFMAELSRRYAAWKHSQIAQPQAGNGSTSNPAAPEALTDDDALDAPEDRMARMLNAAHEALAA